MASISATLEGLPLAMVNKGRNSHRREVATIVRPWEGIEGESERRVVLKRHGLNIPPRSQGIGTASVKTLCSF